MKTHVLSDIQKLTLSAYEGVKNKFSNGSQLQEGVRNAVLEACGGQWDYYKFMDNRYKVFALIAEIMPVAIHANLAGKFGELADFHDTAMGDSIYFDVEDSTIYPLVTAARGNGDIERNKIVDRKFTVPVDNKLIKLYDELDRFMAGRIDLGRLTEKAAISFEHHVGQLIAETIYDSYNALGTDLKVTGAFNASSMDDIAQHVKASTGAERIQIWGTSTALGKIEDGFGYSDTSKDRANNFGHYGVFRGMDLIEIPQAYKPQTTDFAVDRNYAIILPANENIVKVLFEGETLVNMKDGMDRNDMQPEIIYGRRVGAGAITTPEGKFGIYRFT